MAVLGERVLHHRREGVVLDANRDDLAADRVVGVVGSISEMKYGVMSTRNLSGAPRPTFSSSVRSGSARSPRGRSRGARAPAPVVPLRVGHVLVDRCAAADGRGGRPDPAGAPGRTGSRTAPRPRPGLRPGARRRSGSPWRPSGAASRFEFGHRWWRCIESMHAASRRMIAEDRRPGPAPGSPGPVRGARTVTAGWRPGPSPRPPRGRGSRG